ncbi:MAG: hypothetical protein ACOC3V_03295 [bacterium]
MNECDFLKDINKEIYYKISAISIDDSFVRSTILKGLLMFLLYLAEDDILSYIEELSIYGDRKLTIMEIKSIFYNLCSYIFDDNFYYLSFEESINNLDKKVNVLLDSIYINFLEMIDDRLIVNKKGNEFIDYLIDKLDFQLIYSKAILKFNGNVELKTSGFISELIDNSEKFEFADYIYQECYIDNKEKIKSFEKGVQLCHAKILELMEKRDREHLGPTIDKGELIELEPID